MIGHRAPITCLDHDLASGRRVTGGYDGQVVAWHADGVARWTTQFDDLVNDVRFDATAGRVAVAVANGCAYVLDTASGARLEKFGPHGDDVNAVRWSPDGRVLACVMDHLDRAVRLWRVGAGETARAAERTLSGHGSGVFAVAFDHTGRRLATVAEDASARIWDLTDGSVLHVLKHPGDPEALDWSPDGRCIVTGCDDGVARVWDPESGELLHEIADAGAAVRFVRFDAGGARVMLGAYDATMRVYDAATWRVVGEHRAPFQWERAGGFTADGVVAGSFGGAPIEHPTRTARPLPLTGGVNALAVTSTRLVAGRDDGTVVDVLAGCVLARHDTIVNAVAVAPDGSSVVSVDYRGSVLLTPLTSAVAAARGTGDGGPVNAVVWHPDGRTLMAGGYDGCVRRWELDDSGAVPRLICTARFRVAEGPVKSLAWSGAADLLVVGSSDGSLSGWREDAAVWRARGADLVLVNAVACADEAGTVVSASRDRRVRCWDAATGELVDVIGDAHTKSVKAIAAAPDGTHVVTGSYDGTAIDWRRSADNWTPTTLRAHGKPGVPAVAIVGHEVFTAGWDGTVVRWDGSGAPVAEYRLPSPGWRSPDPVSAVFPSSCELPKSDEPS